MVNKKNHKIIYSLIFLFLISCNKKIKLNSESSFGYEDLFSSYDSRSSIFMRKYNDETLRIKIILTKDEKEKILESFAENRFESFPQQIDCSAWGIYPKQYEQLNLNNHSVNYTHNNSGGKGWFCIKGKKFNRIYNTIQSIILNKKEIKRLEPSDIYYE